MVVFVVVVVFIWGGGASISSGKEHCIFMSMFVLAVPVCYIASIEFADEMWVQYPFEAMVLDNSIIHWPMLNNTQSRVCVQTRISVIS